LPVRVTFLYENRRILKAVIHIGERFSEIFSICRELS